jgi:spore coat protein U-like protein
MKRFALPPLSLCLLALAWPATANCSLNAGGVNFGDINPLEGADTDITSPLEIQCDAGDSYRIALDSGNGDFRARHLLDGSNQLRYNLYLDAGRQAIWGDGSGGSSVVTGSGNGSSQTLYIYGRVFADRQAHVGIYADTITVTVTLN